MDYIGIDIGSTAAKAAVTGAHDLRFTLPTGWSSIETAKAIKEQLKQGGVDLEAAVVVATGYGRGAVDFAVKQITEITCHAAGCAAGYPDCTVIDVGGQDTKVIRIAKGSVNDFLMNDKCSAGTGKFIEVMANRLGCAIDDLFALAAAGQALPISSLCTVFAESEVINHIGAGKRRQDIAAGVVDSVAEKVAGLALRLPLAETVLLTGGLSHLPLFAERIGMKLRHPVSALPEGRYAGAYGAARLARNIAEKEGKK